MLLVWSIVAVTCSTIDTDNKCFATPIASAPSFTAQAACQKHANETSAPPIGDAIGYYKKTGKQQSITFYTCRPVFKTDIQ